MKLGLKAIVLGALATAAVAASAQSWPIPSTYVPIQPTYVPMYAHVPSTMQIPTLRAPSLRYTRARYHPYAVFVPYPAYSYGYGYYGYYGY